MANKQINSVFEKCLDCENFTRSFLNRQFRCIFGLIPVWVEQTKEKETVLNCLCYGYVDLPGKVAPARKKLLRRVRRLMKKGKK